MTPRQDIRGWGADLDPKMRPAVPKERNPPHVVAHWKTPERQVSEEKVFFSADRGRLTPVYGTTAPPKGLSGRIRAYAYTFSEHLVRRWFLLLIADRVDMVEGIFQDLGRGHVPNIFAEVGGKAAWKYNRQSVIRKAAIGVGVVGLIALYFSTRRKD